MREEVPAIGYFALIQEADRGGAKISTSNPAPVFDIGGKAVSSPIVAYPTDTAKLDSSDKAQSFTIQCAECADEIGSHLPDCPGVLAAGYHAPELGAFTSTVYPKVGSNFTKHRDAARALRYYLMFGPVELRFEDGNILTMDDLPGGLFGHRSSGTVPE